MVDHHRQGVRADMVIFDEVFQIGHDRLAVRLPVARHLLADAAGRRAVAEEVRREVERHARRDGRFTTGDINDAMLTNRRYLDLADIHPGDAERWIREGRQAQRMQVMEPRNYIVAGNMDDLWVNRAPHAGGVIPAHRGHYATTRVNMTDPGAWVNAPAEPVRFHHLADNVRVPAENIRIALHDNVRVQLDENTRTTPRLNNLMRDPRIFWADERRDPEPFDEADRALADMARRNRERAETKQKEIEMEMQSCACGQRTDPDGDLNQAWEHGPDECTYIERPVDQYVDHGA
jgi:hypothetical protein